MNSKLIKRKLQIGTRQPQFDIVNGVGFQHRWDENKQFEVMNTRYQKGTPLKELNEKLY